MTGTPAPALDTSPVDIRRWIRRRQIAANGRVDLSTVYTVALAVLMVAALLGPTVLAVLWPPAAPTTGTPSVLVIAAAGLSLAAYYWILRQVGPLSVSRSHATWLLVAPVCRRVLLAPTLGFVVSSAVIVGGLVSAGVAARVLDRPASAIGVLTGIIAGSSVALFVALAAVRCQRRQVGARIADRLVGIVVGGFVVVAFATRLTGSFTSTTAAMHPGPMALVVACGLLTAAAAALLLVQRRLDTWPTHQIVEASATTGSYADAVYTAEPSFLADVSIRKYWKQRAGFASSGLFRRSAVPALVSQDLLVARRKAVRMWWLAGTAAAPTVLAGVPNWVLIGIVLFGALGAAGLTTESTHNDAGNPALLRLLGLSWQRAFAQRLVLPSVVAAVWGSAAFAGLQAAGRLDGPWWAMGVAFGPSVAVAALLRAKASAAGVGDVLIDTPLGAFPSGMLLWLTNGMGTLGLLTLPLTIALASATTSDALGWVSVLAQAVLSVAGCALLVRTAPVSAGTLVN